MQVAGIKEIYTAQDLDHFFEIPKKIYKNRSEVVPEDFGLLKELFLNILNNENGLKELRLWVMVGYGRIAVVFDKQTRQGWFGYFDVKAPGTGAAVLLHQAEDFLMQRGAVSITGPVSFAERDRHWGMMQNGQVRHAWGENFHVPGLCDQMPSLGYSSAFKQYTYAVPSGLLQLSWLIPMAERARNRYQLSIISLKTTSPELIKHYFMQVYNEAWPWAEPLTIERTHKLFNEIKPVLIAELVQIVMIGERPVAVFAAIVEPGGYFKGNKPALLSKFQFLFNSWLGRHKHLRGMMFGVVPDFQKKGLEAFMVTHIQRVMMLDYPDAEMELSWVGSFNPTMMKMVEKFGAFVVKTHVVWTKKLS